MRPHLEADPSCPVPTRPGRARAATLLAGLTLVLSACGQQAAAPANGQTDTLAAGVRGSDLGASVTIFTPDMSVEAIRAKFDAITRAQFDNEFGTRRDAVLFMPGTYGTPEQPLNVQVGYYTEVAGLGASPTDVTINGTIGVYNRCLEGNGTGNCIALTNFWRSMSNLTIQVKGGLTQVLGETAPRPDWCTDTEFWAVSQAAPLRRVNVVGPMSFMDYCSAGPQYASGGFMADSQHSGAAELVNGSQQQFYVRGSRIVKWSNAVWNAVFSGVEGAPAETFPAPNPYTVLDQTPVSREKPYLFVDAQGHRNVRVPSAQRGSRGVTWANGLTPGRTLPLTDFFVVRPTDSALAINLQLVRGRHLLFTPGVYDINLPLVVWRPDTVVLGLGYATLTAHNGVVPMIVADTATGSVVAGLTFDAGTKTSPALLQVGLRRGRGLGLGRSDAANPITLSDVFFRVGGPHIGRATTSLEVNSDDVLLDHAWVWRADHGLEGFTQGVNGDTDRWNTNIGRNGAVINGDNVTATGLFVEHYQQHNVVWNGENGTTIFFQNELPYDPPTQEAWNAGNGGATLGWAAYRVADHVRTHRLFGGGAYVFNQNNPSIVTTNGFEVPRTPGVRLHHVLTVNLSAGTIQHVVNGVGDQADNSNTGQPRYVVDYPAP
ncbi:adenylyl cyclase [Deinococcus aestuarii]|uniref:adenylyl cyclase n=1 Tax=Deinococcus aestuarii TaxID=2774531 RepID=UPI001C0AD6B0|nr:adenylyl cyclase [Deinococcus aestuarii]